MTNVPPLRLRSANRALTNLATPAAGLGSSQVLVSTFRLSVGRSRSWPSCSRLRGIRAVYVRSPSPTSHLEWQHTPPTTLVVRSAPLRVHMDKPFNSE